MNFINAMLLGGSAAVLAPLLIHLLNRTQFRRLDWGATRLLEAALKINSRRIEWTSILLLLIRIAIPLVLAICLARPVLTQFRSAATGGSTATQIVIDNSLSMSLPGQTGKSKLKNVQAAISASLEESTNSQHNLTTTTQPGFAVDTTPGKTQPNVLNELAATDISQLANRAYASLVEAIERAAESDSPHKQVWLASDFQAVDWASLSSRQLSRVRESLNVSPLPIGLSLRPTAETAPVANLAIHPAASLPAMVLAGEPLRVAARVTNFGDSDQSTEVSLAVDGVELERKRMELPGHGSREAVFACAISRLGWHHLRLQLSSDNGQPTKDALQADNTAYHVLRVTAAQRVGLVSASNTPGMPSPSGAPNESAASAGQYIQTALAPYTGEQSEQNRFTVTRLTTNQLTAEALSPLAALILAETQPLTKPQMQAIERFVNAGGGLVIFAHDGLQAERLNTVWNSAPPLLPLEFGSVTTVATTGTAPPLENTNLDRLRSILASSLATTHFSKWMPLRPGQQPGEAADSSQPVQIFLRSVDGTPILAGHQFGQGYVVQAGFSLNTQWSNFALRPALLPLLQQLVLLSSSQDAAQHNIQTGQLANWEQWTHSQAEFSITRIEADPSAANEAWARTVSRSASTRLNSAGVYRVTGTTRIATPTEAGSADAGPLLAKFAVNLPIAESDLRVLSRSEIEQLAADLGGTVAADADQFEAQQALRRLGKEIWPWMLGIVLVLMFAETWLAARISRGGL